MAHIGLMLEGQAGLNWQRWDRILQAAEEFGFQCVFRSDHYTIAPPEDDSLETFISLTHAADHTHRIEFGTLVAPTTFRHPSLTARMAAQIDDLSKGRLVIGLGAGWNEREHNQFGIPFYDVPTRHEMLEDALNITRLLFNSNEPVSYAGKHFSLDKAIMLPRPHRPGGPPILIGGNGKKMTLPLVAKFADEWNGVFIDPAGYRERMDILNGYLEGEGRQPSAVKRSLMTQIVFGADDAAVQRKKEHFFKDDPNAAQPNRIVGTSAAVIDQIGAYIDAGVERFMLQWLELDNLDDIELLAKEVLPYFQG
jgi:F420-dependent oxidoreductase-like protein